MSKSLLRKSVKALLGGAILTAGLGLSASQANADVIAELRFSDTDLTTRSVPAGFTGPLNLSLYLTITGGNADPDELLVQVATRIGSEQLNGGAVSGSVQSVTELPIWYSIAGSGPANGLPGNWSPVNALDDFGDWGTNVPTTRQISSTCVIPQYSNYDNSGASKDVGGGLIGAAFTGDVNNDGTAEVGVRWKIADVVINITGTKAGGGQTTLTPTPFGNSYVSVFQDGREKVPGQNATNGGAWNGIPVTISIGGQKYLANMDSTGTGTGVVTLTTTGTAGRYKPVKKDVPADAGLTGSADVVRPDAMSNGDPILIMMWLTDTNTSDSETVASFVSAMASSANGQFTILGPGNTEYNKLKYLGFDALLSFSGSQYPSGAGPFEFHWDLTAVSANTGIRVSALAMVPEPASLGLVALGGLAMLRRRRD